MIGPVVVAVLLAAAPGAASFSVEALPFEPEAWAKAEPVQVTVMEEGDSVTYAGVPLAAVLKGRLKGRSVMAELRSVSDAIILVKARDGYQAAVSAVAAAMDPKGERYVLAIRRNGKPLGDGQAPVKLVIPGDPMRVRWVRMVSALQLIRPSSGK
jgi:hypothetical protein